MFITQAHTGLERGPTVEVSHLLYLKSLPMGPVGATAPATLETKARGFGVLISLGYEMSSRPAQET